MISEYFLNALSGICLMRRRFRAMRRLPVIYWFNCSGLGNSAWPVPTIIKNNHTEAIIFWNMQSMTTARFIRRIVAPIPPHLPARYTFYALNLGKYISSWKCCENVNHKCSVSKGRCTHWSCLVLFETGGLTHLPQTKWPPFRRRYLRIQISWNKCFAFWSKRHWGVFLRVQLAIPSCGLENGLVPNWW